MARTEREPAPLPEDPAERLATIEARMERVFQRRQAAEAEASAKRAKAAAAAAADRRIVLAEQSRQGHARRALRLEGDTMTEEKRARIAAGLTLDQVAALGDIARTTVHEAERGKPVSSRSLRRIRRALSLPV